METLHFALGPNEKSIRHALESNRLNNDIAPYSLFVQVENPQDPTGLTPIDIIPHSEPVTSVNEEGRTETTFCGLAAESNPEDGRVVKIARTVLVRMDAENPNRPGTIEPTPTPPRNK